MDIERLQACLLSDPDQAPSEGDSGAAARPLTPAAVLVPLVPRPAGLQVLLTQRTEHLRDHPGQISFPGGRLEPGDVSPVHAALREAEEEIGLARHVPRVLGYLPLYRTATGFQVYPVVALIEPPFTLALDAFEVAEAFEVPLAFLLDPRNHRRVRLHYRGALREYTAMPYGERYIWGATAGMILSLARRLGAL
ncbi:MAG: CoA pyrophosphatase [Azovibrio sp.]|nr:CoA pyrophosphatase [Azovibrio sp.]